MSDNSTLYVEAVQPKEEVKKKQKNVFLYVVNLNSPSLFSRTAEKDVILRGKRNFLTKFFTLTWNFYQILYILLIPFIIFLHQI